MHPLRTAPRRLLPALLLLLLAVGCGSKDKSEIKVADVGDRSITLDYFERKMNTMDPQHLPADIGTREGRLELLETMVNKEVMAIKAEELGYAADPTVDASADAMAEMKAVESMRADVTKDLSFISDEEVFDYYENLSRKLKVSYMLLDHEDEARNAKGLVEGGEDWIGVAMRKSVTPPGAPETDYTMNIRYGTVVDDLEQAVFSLPAGQVSDPIETIYGYFLIRVEGQSVERVPPLDQIRDKVLESIFKQKSGLAVKAFIEEVFKEYDFTINEEALQKVFDALPPDPELNPPPPREELQPLNLAGADMDLELMHYADQVWTLRRYYDFYDQNSALGRPRRDRMVGGLRRGLKEIAIRELMPLAAEKRGYMELPEVKDEYKERREQAMVTALHKELISDVVRVSEEEMRDYWAGHAQDFIQPERRETLALVAATEEDANEARRQALAGVEWAKLLEEHCVEGEVKMAQGLMGRLTADDPRVYAEAVFSLSGEGEVCEPRQIGDNQWLIVQCKTIFPYLEPTFEQVSRRLGNIVKANKEEALLQQRLGEWKQGLAIQRYPENLDKAVYDPQPQQSQKINLFSGQRSDS